MRAAAATFRDQAATPAYAAEKKQVRWLVIVISEQKGPPIQYDTTEYYRW